MKKAIFLSLLGIILLVALIGGGKALQIRDLIRAGEGMQPPPVTISSELAEEMEWETTLRAVGAMEAAQGLLITADIAGRISAINFTAGSEVAAGALLVEQEISSEESQLGAATADAALAKSNLDRVNRLFRQKIVARAEYDAAQAAYQSAVAAVASVRASLDKKQIIAPFAGRLGLRQVDIGQSISVGTPIVSLQAADPMLLNFALPQHNLGKIARGYAVRVATDAVPDTPFDGTITAINSEIDVSTRSVSVQATLDNPGGELLPGMFASVSVVLPEVRKVLVVPITSISYASYGDSVFVIEEQQQPDADEVALVARQQFVQLGAAQGDFVSVLAGLSAGERVASAGVFKLRNGAPVALNEKIKSGLDLNPQLPDQ